MMPASELAWLAAALVLGAVAGYALGRGRNKVKVQRAKLALADSQQRRALERLSETNRDLKAQMEAAGSRQSQTVESIKRQHTTEVQALQAEISLLREQLMAYTVDDGDDRGFSPTSFATTQFSDTRR